MSSVSTDDRVKVENPTQEQLSRLNVTSWPIWTKEVSVFDWHYDQEEVCYLLEGEVTVTTDQGATTFKKGDLVTFSKGLSCNWQIHKAVRKHYLFR